MILAVMVAAPTLAATMCLEPAPAPKYQVGDKWTWRDERGDETTNEAIQIEGDMTQIQWANGNVAFLDKDRILRKVRKANGEVVTQQGAGEYVMVGQKVLDFPLHTGKKWSFSYMGNPGNTNLTMTSFYHDNEVVGCEEVTTPAGKFPAFKVQVDQRMTSRQVSGTFYLWYAPAVKMPVKHHYVLSQYWKKTRDNELIKFEVK